MTPARPSARTSTRASRAGTRERAADAGRRSKAAAAPALEGKRLDAYSLRSRIVGKAAGVLGKQGAADTTVEDILRAAGVSRRTFYRFFDSKEDVLDALHEIGCNMLIGAARQIATLPGEPADRLARALEAYLEYHVTVGDGVMYVVQGESMRPGSKLEPRRRAFLDTMAGMLADETERATGTRVDPLLFRSLLVAIEGVSLTLHADSKSGTYDRDRARRVMHRIVMATIASPAGGVVPPLPTVPST
jgi:AcrR family transcriptional regulator